MLGRRGGCKESGSTQRDPKRRLELPRGDPTYLGVMRNATRSNNAYQQFVLLPSVAVFAPWWLTVNWAQSVSSAWGPAASAVAVNV